MAAPVVYGQIEVVTAQGKPKLSSTLSPRVKVDINKFDVNNTVYVHINSRNKSVSLTWEEYEEVCGLKTNMDQKLHLLEQVSFFF